MSAPRTVIVLEYEAAPRVEIENVDESNAARLVAWMGTHPELLDLVHHAIQVETEWERRAAA